MAWITDGSTGFSINGNVVTYINVIDDVDNAFNCMWEEGNGVSSGKHYWKIYFDALDGDASIGLTSKECFKMGNDCIGLWYNGNLSDKSGIVVSDFGASPSQGDTIGIFVSFEAERLKVYFDIKKKSLGLAFNLAASEFTSVFPAIRFIHSGSAICQKEIEIPTTTKRFRTIFSGIEGDWKLKTMTENRTGLSIFSGFTKLLNSATTNLKRTCTDEYHWFIETTNSFSARLYKENGKWKTSSIYSTALGSFCGMEFENQISNLMRMVETVNIEPDGSLFIKSDTLSTVWKRYDVMSGFFITNLCSNENSKCQIM